jgi:cytochrome c oxidase subunit 3
MAQVSTSPARQRAGAVPVLFGTILFLASELLFFGGLFGAYFALRSQTTPWPPEGVELETVLAAVATTLLVLSSLTFHLGLVAARRQRAGGLRVWIVVTIVLGGAFLTMQIVDWVSVPFEVSSNAYGTMYYALTGMHGLHVLAGLLLMAIVLLRLGQGAYRGGHVDGLHAVGYYWHFVDIVWIALFTVLFVVR